MILARLTASMALFDRRFLRPALIGGVLLLAVGCESDLAEVREIQVKRQASTQARLKQDHLGEAFSLVSRMVELNPEKSRRQIAYHLNQWAESSQALQTPMDQTPDELLKSISPILPLKIAQEFLTRDVFTPDDINHVRDCYVFSRIVGWADGPDRDDPLLSSWFESLDEELTSDQRVDLRTASRLFDWTVRNVALETDVITGNAPPSPPMSLGMQFQGAGYRQTDYQTVWRGTGDGLQRAGVFTLLCRQAGIDAAVLAVPGNSDRPRTAWCVGVLIGDEVYLFEPRLGLPIPGPDQTGIATLTQARRDSGVMRRLTVQGYFDYPFSKDDVQQCEALLNAEPPAVSYRMQRLEDALTGDRRMTLFLDAQKVGDAFAKVRGISKAQFWEMPYLSAIYQQDMIRQASQDQMFASWYQSSWAILEGAFEAAEKLAMGRWKHLHGEFSDDEDENLQGARTLYLQQRSPEFEISDLRIDPDLQKRYGVQRALGMSEQEFNQMIVRSQAFMRLGKRTATYWLSLVQYDDARFEPAANWFRKRSLDTQQRSFWEPAAKYNLARTFERIGIVDEAIALYKTEQVPQEHGNRIRARLLARFVAGEDNKLSD
ncbi:MAG: hypothetical protein AAGA03_12480 [Planctomycetota bacterium]